jgi:trans-2,3-dihydro-3-hydroxyanthranilate isomerase
MPSLSFVHCDVFTSRPFGGNPLAVFPEAPDLDTNDMQAIARELNLSETVFVRPPDNPDEALRRLRIFTPSTELPIAGHPVIGTWWVLAEAGVVLPPPGGTGETVVNQQLGVGVLPVSIELRAGRPSRVIMTQPSPTISAPLPLEVEAADVLGLAAEDLLLDELPIVVASVGVPILLVRLKDRRALGRARSRQRALDALLESAGARGLYATSWESTEQIHARMFAGSGLGIVEDPATGSAAGPFGGALLHFGLLTGASSIEISQGEDMGRPSQIFVDVDDSPGGVSSVRVAGSAVTLIRGELAW